MLVMCVADVMALISDTCAATFSQHARAKKLRFGRSKIHAWGVFAEEPLQANEMLLEYKGELIGNTLADKRADEYERKRVSVYRSCFVVLLCCFIAVLRVVASLLC